MKVVHKTRHAVTFGNLKVGDQFEKGGNIYLRVTHEKGTPNAVALSGCYEGTVTVFESDAFVRPVTIELHVFDKA